MPLALAVLLIAPTREARFDVMAKGRKAGVATYRVSDRPGGGRVTRLRVVLADRSVSESVAESDALGAPTRSSSTVRRGAATTKETVAYSPRGDATIVVNGGRPVLVPFDRRGSRRDPSETWFRGVMPSPGTWAIFRALDSRRRVWEPVKVTYVGRRGEGNLVRQVRGAVTTDYVLDDEGLPISTASGDVRMVRR